MRIGSVKELQSPSVEPGAIPEAGGDDFLSRVNTTLTNFRQLLKLVQDLRGMTAETNEQGAPHPSPGASPGLSKANLVNFIDILIQRGYGETTIGEVIEKVKPFNIKQIKEFLKHAGLGK